MSNKVFIYLRRIIYIGFGILDRVLGKPIPRIFILCYHSISDDHWIHSISKNNFIKQINYLLKNFNLISLNDLDLFLSGKKNISGNNVILTFDDGYKNILGIKSFLLEKNVKPGVFIIADRENINQKELGTDQSLLNIKEINDLHNCGWIIGSHSMTHSNFLNLSQKELESEIIESKIRLERLLSFKINYFAYPRGRYSIQIIDCLKTSGYALGLSMDDEEININTDKYKIPRIGVNNTQSFLEFKYMMSPSVIKIRNIIKKFIVKSNT